jgi:hypothetical protein
MTLTQGQFDDLVQSYYTPANLLLGKILIEKNDISGIRYIESAAKCDTELAISCYELLIDFFYYELGNTEKVKHYQNEIEQHYYRLVFAGSGQ